MEIKITEKRRTTYLSDEVAKLLVEQFQHEQQNKMLYLNCSTWCNVRGLVGNSKYFLKSGKDENGHSEIIYKHLVDSNFDFTIPTIETQELTIKGDSAMEQVKCLHKAALDREIDTTERLKNLCKVSLDQGDYLTFGALQPLMLEQIEEENKTGTALDQFDFTTDLLILDQRIGKLA